jgi:hypothetical protein
MSAKYSGLWEKAVAAGYAAGRGAEPEPMVVVGGVPGEKPKAYFVSEGVCGFAWVKVRPGNSKFANWLKKEGLASNAYGGGVSIWISDYNQSMDRKYAHASAMAEVLRAGLEGERVSVYADSRMD